MCCICVCIFFPPKVYVICRRVSLTGTYLASTRSNPICHFFISVLTWLRCFLLNAPWISYFSSLTSSVPATLYFLIGLQICPHLSASKLLYLFLLPEVLLPSCPILYYKFTVILRLLPKLLQCFIFLLNTYFFNSVFLN